MKLPNIFLTIVSLLSVNFTILAQSASSDSPSAMGANFARLKFLAQTTVLPGAM